MKGPNERGKNVRRLLVFMWVTGAWREREPRRWGNRKKEGPDTKRTARSYIYVYTYIHRSIPRVTVLGY